MALSYCDIAPGDPWHGPYHDTEYGFPVTDDRQLFERQCLEIFQAGLSWLIVLKKRAGLNAAFDGFSIARVAAYGDADRARLVADPRIIRNRRKIAAVIDNARRLQEMRRDHGSFAAWIEAHHPRPRAEWVRLFRSQFAFMGPEVVGEFLQSIGVLAGAHRPECPVHARILAADPPWRRVGPAERPSP